MCVEFGVRQKNETTDEKLVEGADVINYFVGVNDDDLSSRCGLLYIQVALSLLSLLPVSSPTSQNTTVKTNQVKLTKRIGAPYDTYYTE
jgi:hypothetical protein